ncbi:galactose mutarotase [Parabacteroides sp. OttesenSCG-928-G06]|nr:galactose mutarotase [Parabacteroides sp. OttesenSCG-928-G06]
MKKLWMLLFILCLCVSCDKKTEEATLSGLMASDFEATVDGKETHLYVLTNSTGAEACITNYGACLVSLMVPDRNGVMTDVVLGRSTIQDYLETDGNFGATIGRYGNRIQNGTFTLDGETFDLPKNNNGHTLHGGPEGFHRVAWEARLLDQSSLMLTYLSADGEQGFPGELSIQVQYLLTDDNEIQIIYSATTDKATVFNPTNHSYFNLSGKLDSRITDQLLMINADYYTPVDATLIPTGELAPVEGTPMDLRRMQAIGEYIDDDFEQLKYGKGYDHNWVLNTNGNLSEVACKAYSEASGIYMEVYTTEPGVQLYTGNAMSGNDKGKHGLTYPHRGAFCLETQHYPDSPNQPEFPSTVLRPGVSFLSRTIYKFGVE